MHRDSMKAAPTTAINFVLSGLPPPVAYDSEIRRGLIHALHRQAKFHAERARERKREERRERRRRA